MVVQHVYNQTVADGTATSVVRPSDWNSGHNQTVSLTGNTAGTSTVSGTDVIWAGGNNITLSGSSNSITISAPNQSFLIGGNNITLSSNANSISISGPNMFNGGISNIGNTLGTSGTFSNQLVLAGGNNIVLSQATGTNGATITISASSQSNQVLTMFALGATAGQSSSTTIDARSMSFTATNISVGFSGGSILLSDMPNLNVGISNIGNTSGTSGTFTNQVVFAGGTNITLSQSTGAGGATITISGAGGGPPNRSYIEVIPGERFTTIRNFSETVFSNRPIFQPFWVNGTGISPATIRMIVSGITSSNNSLQMTMTAALYSEVNSTQMSLFGTATVGFNISSSASNTIWSGNRLFDITGMTGTMSTEGRWILGLLVGSGGSTKQNVAVYGADNLPNLVGILSAGTSANTTNTPQIFPWWGLYSTTTGAFPNSVAISQVAGGNSGSCVEFWAVIKAI